MAVPKTPLLAVDCVALDAGGRLLLVSRKNPPFAGALALPGGFVQEGETVEAACRREVREETGVTVGKLTLIGVYSAPGRDPRGHVCSVAFLARAKGSRAKAASDASAVTWLKDWRSANLAFDHHGIVTDAFRLLGK